MESQEVKKKAKLLKELLAKKGIEIKHTQSLEIMSQLENNFNWHNSALIQSKKITTGIVSLDRLLQGGLVQGEVTGIISPWDHSDRDLSLSICSHIIKKNEKLLILDLVGGRTGVAEKIYSNLSKINIKETQELSDKEKQKMTNIVNKYQNKFQVRVLHGGSFSLDEVKDALLDIKANFDFNVLYIHGIEHLGKNNRRLSKIIPDKIDIAKEINLLAKAFHCAIITQVPVIQRLDKKYDKTQILRAHEVTKEVSPVQQFSNLIMLFNNEDSKYTLLLDKSREGKNNIVMKLKKTTFGKFLEVDKSVQYNFTEYTPAIRFFESLFYRAKKEGDVVGLKMQVLNDEIEYGFSYKNGTSTTFLRQPVKLFDKIRDVARKMNIFENKIYLNIDRDNESPIQMHAEMEEKSDAEIYFKIST